MRNIKSYRDLDVWKQSRLLVKSILSKAFPKEEPFGLTNQVRRAAISVASNLTEGFGRNHSKDSVQFFFIACSSFYEVESQLIIAVALRYVKEHELREEFEQVSRCKTIQRIH